MEFATQVLDGQTHGRMKDLVLNDDKRVMAAIEVSNLSAV